MRWVWFYEEIGGKMFLRVIVVIIILESTIEMAELPIVILDANAFISGQGLLELGAKHKLVTIPEVMEELRDPKTREMMEKYVFEIEEIRPDKKSIEFIKEFARKTGDIASLSDVDM